MTTGKSCAVCVAVGILVTIGALNWGLIGLSNFNLVQALLGDMTPLARAVYILVGVAGVLKLLSFFKCCPCQKGSCETKS